jgi:hypothetical protein
MHILLTLSGSRLKIKWINTVLCYSHKINYKIFVHLPLFVKFLKFFTYKLHQKHYREILQYLQYLQNFAEFLNFCYEISN